MYGSSCASGHQEKPLTKKPKCCSIGSPAQALGIVLIPASLPEQEEHSTGLFETFLTGTGADWVLSHFPVGCGP